ncbi:unnamed protein product [Rhodiola kirilowii]
MLCTSPTSWSRPLLPSPAPHRAGHHLNRKRFSIRMCSETKVEYTPWLIAGLGNPGNKYHGTRHNVGFEMIDKIAQEEGIVMNTIQSKALLGMGTY